MPTTPTYKWIPRINEGDMIHEAGMVMKWFNVFFGRFERHGRYTMSSSYNSYQEAKNAVVIPDHYVCTIPAWLPIKSDDDVRRQLQKYKLTKKELLTSTQ